MNVDAILEKLLAVRTQKGSKFVCLSFDELYFLCYESKLLFLSEPSLLEIPPPVNICGDIHGQYSDLLKLLDFTGHPPTPYLFLGDYVDRGKHSIETISLLLCYKLKFPKKVYLLRGNHEAANINKLYGFFDECKRRYDAKLWRAFIQTFDCLPIGALVGNRILCMHGGLSPSLNSLDDIRNIKRPTDVPDDGLLCDLLWADPDSALGWRDNDRGVSYTFGPDVVQTFVKKFDIDLIARAHQVVEDGYQFHGKRQVVTIFSAPNYCNEWDNSGAVMAVDEHLVCSFHRLVPNSREKRRKEKMAKEKEQNKSEIPDERENVESGIDTQQKDYNSEKEDTGQNKDNTGENKDSRSQKDETYTASENNKNFNNSANVGHMSFIENKFKSGISGHIKESYIECKDDGPSNDGCTSSNDIA